MTAPSSASSSSASFVAGSTKSAMARSQMEIRLKNHFRSKVYNSGSPVEGEVAITTQRDVRFDTLQILLVGLCRSRMEGVSVPQTTTHTLLKLAMPIPESAYPVPRVLEAGRTYTIPFIFVVPNHLTIGACTHKVDFDGVRDHHLELPPTMGAWEKDDMSPETARVEYSVKARVLREADLPGMAPKIMETAEQIKILPTSAERAPLHITHDDRLYRMTKSKTLRKNLISSKLGQVTASAVQPRAIFLRSDGLRATETTASVQLVFDTSSADSAPPRVTGVSGKITAHTFWGCGPMMALPDLTDTRQFATDRRAAYSTSVPLESTAATQLDGIRWQQQLRGSARRDSGYSSGGYPPDDENDGSNARSKQSSRRSSTVSPMFHNCIVDVPIRLPSSGRKGKTFIPTFHSCLAARVYTLHLSISLASGGAAGSTSLTLSLPLQIAAEPSAESVIPLETLPDFETAVHEAEADEHLRPRTMSIPAALLREATALPGYA